MTGWQHHNQLTFAKNEKFWDAANVRLKEVVFMVADETLALTFFQQNKLDWAGSPISALPQDAIAQLKEKQELNITDACGTYWFRFNMAETPFSDNHMRKAFNLALNRDEIVKYVMQGNQQPALGILPTPLKLQANGFFKDNAIEEARHHFNQALTASGLSKEDMPTITLCYGNNERHHKIAQAVQQQWQTAFAIPISMQACEAKVSYDRLAKGNYQIMLGSWFADFADPINFLNIFHSMDTEYARLLDHSNSVANPEERKAELLKAETILIDKMPVAPLFYNAFNFVKKDYVSDVYFSPLGYLDFRHAQVNGKNEISARG